jgi:hypothetical protein
MDHHTIIGLGTEIGLAIGLGVFSRRRPKKPLDEQIEDALRGGELSFPELVQALGIGGVDAHARVSEALSDLIHRERVKVIAAPLETAELEKIHHTKYKLRP